MLHAKPKQISNWIENEFHCLLQLVEGEQYDNVKWDNKWFVDDDKEDFVEEEFINTEPNHCVSTPKISDEKRKEIREKARESSQKLNQLREEEIQGYKSAIEALEDKYGKILTQNKDLLDKVNKQSERIKHLEGSVKSLDSTECKNKIIKLEDRLKIAENKLNSNFLKEVSDDDNLDIKEKIAKLEGDNLIVEEDIKKIQKDLDKQCKNNAKKIENSKIELNEFLDKRVDDLKKNFEEEFKKLAKEDKRDISKEEQFIKDCVDDYFKEKHNTIIAKENENWGQDDSFETFSVHEEDQSKAKEPTPFQFVRKKSTSTPQLNTETLPDDLQHLIVGDSIVQGIKNQQFHKGQNTKVISLRGRGLQEVRKYFQSVLLEGSQPKNIFIHVGSNDVLNDTAENFIKEYETLIEEIKIKFQDSKLFVSLIIQKVNNEHFN